MKKFGLVIIFLIVGIATCIYFYNNTDVESFEQSIPEPTEREIVNHLGYNISNHSFLQDTIQKNEFLADILLPYGVSLGRIHTLAQTAKEVFPVRNLRVDKPYHIVLDSCKNIESFLYVPNNYRYVHYNLKDSIYVKVVEHPITKVWNTGAGYIKSSLWNSMVAADMSPTLISRMEDALAWSIDFHHTQKGDEYKLLYEKEIIDGKEVGIGTLIGAYYKNDINEYYAIWYDSENYGGFYDEEGRPMKKTFLRSPVKFSRVSSGYSLTRFHPVLKRVKPHFGTDYAAPHGTPIIAVANGVVIKASRTRGNGNYVKLKHNDTYQTQYLHMSRFAQGIKSGVHVKQGQTIGYVGSTGLATGPHVCFRFWKNGKQVNHRALNFPPAEPMPQEELELFFSHRDSIMQLITRIPSAKIESEYPVINPDTTALNIL